jgi:tetratricopeptide (TPR) repeat protein
VALNRTKVLEAAQKYLAKSQYDKAIAEYEKLVQEDPRDVRTLLKIGDLHTRRARPRDAVDVYNRVAELYAKQGFFLKAVAVYKQILKLVPGDLPTTERLGRMYEELALTNDALGTYEIVADAHINQGDLQRAIEVMERMVAMDGQNVAARIKLAEGLSKADRKQEAAEAFAAGATLLREQGRTDDYLRVVERQLYHDPENVEVSRELAGLYLERSDAKRALAKLQPCFKADPRHIPTLEMLAGAFGQLGQTAKTVSVLKEVARLQGEAGDAHKRAETLQRVLELDPSDTEARTATALLKGKRARPEPELPAEPSRGRIKPPPPSAPARASIEPEPLADDDLSLLEESESEGVLMVDEDVPAEPVAGQAGGRMDPDALLEEAELLESEQRYAEAEALLQRILHVVPDLEEAHALLKDIYLATDRREQAVHELLWLSDAFTDTDDERARNYALTAYQHAPTSERTQNRLRALGLQAEDAQLVEDAQPVSEAPDADDEPVMFVADDDAPVPAPAKAPATSALAPLDIPLDPDEFDAAPPSVHRPLHSREVLAALLDAPISQDDFDDDLRDPAWSVPPLPQTPSEEMAIDEVAALLDQPISASEFATAAPSATDANKYAKPAHHATSGASRAAARSENDTTRVADLGAFDLGASEFERSDLIDAARIAEAPQPTRIKRPVLEVLDDAPSEPPPEPTVLANISALQPEYAAANTSRTELDEPAEAPFDSQLFDESPDPTLPSEPIPDLIFRSSRPEPDLTAESEPPAEDVTHADLPVSPGPQPAPAPPVLPSAPRPPLFSAPPSTPALPPRPLGPTKPVALPVPAAAAPKPLVISRPVALPSPALGPVAKPAGVPAPGPRPAPEPAVPHEPAAAATAPTSSQVAASPLLPTAEEPTITAVDESPPSLHPPISVPVSAPSSVQIARPPGLTPSGRPVWDDLPPELEETLDEADFFATQGLLDEALDVVREAMLIYPGTPAIAAKVAHYESLKAKEQSKAGSRESLGDASFDIAEKLAAGVSDTNVAAVHDEMVDVESVFAQFKKGVALQIAPEDTDTHFDLAIAYKEMGLLDDAITEFELAAHSPRRACTALTMIAMCYVERGERQRAIRYFERALSAPQKTPPEELGLLFELGAAYEGLGQLDDALSAFERVAIRDRTFRNVSARVDQLRRKRELGKGIAR